MMKLMIWSLLMAISTLQVYAQDCTKFVVLDTYSSSSNYTVYEKTKDAICKETILDRSSATDAGVSAGIPIPVLDDIFSLNLNGSTASNDWSHWREHFCKSSYYEQYVNLQNSNLSKIFSDNAKSVVESCLNSEPVYAYFEVPPNGKSFTFTFRVQGKDKLRAASVKPAESVGDCDPTNPFALSWYYERIGDVDISGQKKAFSCSWNSAKNVSVELKLDNQGDRAYLLPAITKREIPPPPPPKPTWHTEDPNGQPYVEFWTMDPNCTGKPYLITRTHRCQFEHTQIPEPGDNTKYDTWNLYIDAPGPVYEVGCETTGVDEIKNRGIPQGNTGLCTGEINGGDADIRMHVKWKQLW